MMLLLNAPTLFLWIGLLLCSNTFSTLIGYTTAGVQGLILFGMLIREIGEPTNVLLINGIILVSQGLIAGICHWLHRRANPNPTA
jgi:high-affinity Fe2+/Pb2+ permease